MKKSGYTLIELIVVIAITVVLLSVGFKVKNSIDKFINETRKESSINDIYNVLSYGKYYCKVNRIEGAIKVDKATGEVFLYEDIRNGKTIKKITLHKGLQFVSDLKLKVTATGNLQAGTIYLKDNSKAVSKITISVGIDNINIY